MNVLGISGSAGAGKDAIANRLVSEHGWARMSFADGMKRFSRDVFSFTDDQVFGCIDEKNAIDARYHSGDAWEAAIVRLSRLGPTWCRNLFSDNPSAYLALLDWFGGLARDYGLRGLSPRVVLQTIGTEWGRAVDPQVWVRTTLETARELLTFPGWGYERDLGLFRCPGRKPPPGVVIPDCRFGNELDAVKAAGGKVIRVVRPGFDGAVGVPGHRSEAEQRAIPDSAFDAVILNRGTLEDLGCAVDVLVSTLNGRSAA